MVPEVEMAIEVDAKTDSGNGSRGLNVVISDDAYRALEKIAKKRGKTVDQILRDALAHETWFQDELDNGNRLLLENKGNVKEIVLK